MEKNISAQKPKKLAGKLTLRIFAGIFLVMLFLILGVAMALQIEIGKLVPVILMAVAGLLVLSLFCYFQLLSALKPVCELENAARELAAGNLNAKIAFRSSDELGSLAENLRLSLAMLRSNIGDIDATMQKMASGNFRGRLSNVFSGDFKNIEASIALFTSEISGTMLEISQSAGQVATASEQVSDGAQTLSEGASEQAGAITELSSVVKKISNQVRQNAQSASDVNEKTIAVGDEIEKGGMQMVELIVAMDDVNNASQEIEKIIKTIDDIAFQTNILALNASIEAARAGAAGKGFAVVADEVRNLAGKSAAAAKDTSALINNSIKAAEKGTEMLDATANSLSAITEGTQEITSLIGEITTASQEQAQAIMQVERSIEQISAVVQTNSATAQESAATSEELTGQAQLMKGMVEHFQLSGAPASAQGKNERKVRAIR